MNDNDGRVLGSIKYYHPFRWNLFEWTGGPTLQISMELALMMGWRGNDTLVYGPYRLKVYGGTQTAIYGIRVSGKTEEYIRRCLLLAKDLALSFHKNRETAG